MIFDYFFKFSMRSLIVLLAFLIYSSGLMAQESIMQLSVNPVIIQSQNLLETGKTRGIKDVKPLTLPFYDDFSTSYIYPDTSLWADNFAYINNTFAVKPPTIGVATLDALDAQGVIYKKGGSSSMFEADFLTSRPINLNITDKNNIYLSFYYQPQGNGDIPEPEDSLVVEFYAPVEKTWIRQWSKPGSKVADFKLVMLPVKDQKFLLDGFQFRFKNYVTLSSMSKPSLVANADHWHVDYVYLNKGRSATDTVYHDIAFTAPMRSMLKDYESVPWTHFQKVKSDKIYYDTLKVEFKNNDNINRNINLLYFLLVNRTNNKILGRLSAGTRDIKKFQQMNLVAKNDSLRFPVIARDSAEFELKCLIETDDFDQKGNNTVSYFQKFYNYYAYDDGTCEVGYGLTGEGTKNARLAYKFNTYVEDSLQGVYMYFNQSYNFSNKQFFVLTIWKDENGVPGDTLYTQSGSIPLVENKLNKFAFYELKRKFIPPTSFFVGWTQTTTDFLNVGLDLNRNASDKTFYNISGEWVKSSIKGALMIRPVFGKKVYPLAAVEKPEINPFLIYPNPASEKIIIQMQDNTNFQKMTLSIFDTYGRMVIQKILIQNPEEIRTDNLPAGIYYLRISNGQKVETTKKIIISK